jgi:DNA polymerase-1
MRALERASATAIDFETLQLDPFSRGAKILSLAIATESDSYAMPLSHRDSPFLGDVAIQTEWIRFAHSRPVLIAHNAKYEMRWFRAFGLPARTIAFDTMVVHHLLNENASHGLDSIASEYTDHGGYHIDFESQLKSKNNYESAPLDALLEYNAMDALVTAQAAVQMMNELRASPHLLDVWKEFDGPLVKILAEMEHVGFVVAGDRLKELRDWYERKLESQEALIRAYIPLREYFVEHPTFNFNSQPQLVDLLYGQLGFTVGHRTKPSKRFPAGAPSINRLQLETLAKGNEHRTVLAALMTRTKAHSMLKSFIDVFQQRMAESVDGRLRTTFNQHVVETYRLSSSNPNLQNLPRSGDLEAAEFLPIKRAFVSRFPEGQIVQADFSQLELRVAAMYTLDETLHRAFREGRDLHAEMAEHVYGEGFTKEERYKAKRTNFSAVFEIGPESLSTQIGSSYAEAVDLLRAFRALHPELFAWFDKLWQLTLETGVVRNFLGRERHLGSDIRHAEEQGWRMGDIRRSAINFPIQSTAADMMKRTLIRVNTSLLAGKARAVIIGTVHDSIIVDSPPDETARVAQLLKTTMENLGFSFINVPVVADVTFGPDMHTQVSWKPS